MDRCNRIELPCACYDNDNEYVLLLCSRYIDTSNHTHSIHHYWYHLEYNTLDKHIWRTRLEAMVYVRSSHIVLTLVLLAMIFFISPWWRHQIEAFSALLALCEGNSSATGEFPAQKASDAELRIPLYDTILMVDLGRQLDTQTQWKDIFLFQFHWNLFPTVQITISPNWFRWQLGA